MRLVIVTMPRTGSTLLVEIIKNITNLSCRSEIFRTKLPKNITGNNPLAPTRYFKETNLGVNEYLKLEFGNSPICFKVMIEQLLQQPKVFYYLIKSTNYWILNRREYFSDSTISMYVKNRVSENILIPVLPFIFRTLLHRLEFLLLKVLFKLFGIKFVEVNYELYKDDYKHLETVLKKMNNDERFRVKSSENISKLIKVKKRAFGDPNDVVKNISCIMFIRKIIR